MPYGKAQMILTLCKIYENYQLPTDGHPRQKGFVDVVVVVVVVAVVVVGGGGGKPLSP